MVKQARAKGIVFKNRIDDDEAVPESLGPAQAKIKQYLDDQGHYTSRASDWHKNEPVAQNAAR